MFTKLLNTPTQEGYLPGYQQQVRIAKMYTATIKIHTFNLYPQPVQIA